MNRQIVSVVLLYIMMVNNAFCMTEGVHGTETDTLNTNMIHFTGNNGSFDSDIAHMEEDHLDPQLRNVPSVVDNSIYGAILENLYAINPLHVISKKLSTFTTLSNLGVKIMALNMNHQISTLHPIIEMKQSKLSASISANGSIMSKSGINIFTNIHYNTQKTIFKSSRDGKSVFSHHDEFGVFIKLLRNALYIRTMIFIQII